MEIHAYEKLWLALSLVLIVGFVATVTYGAVGAGVAMVDDSGGTVDPGSIGEHPQFSEPGVYVDGDGDYHVYVVSRQFLFEPGTNSPIVLPAGTPVTFHVTAADVIHGFEVVGTNANTMAVPGQIADITVVFEEDRDYGLLCNEYCGAGHHVMEGQIRIVPAGEFNESTVVGEVDA